MLTITDLVKQYPTGLKALHGVSLSITEPQVVAIIGPSGAGKSTPTCGVFMSISGPVLASTAAS